MSISGAAVAARQAASGPVLRGVLAAAVLLLLTGAALASGRAEVLHLLVLAVSTLASRWSAAGALAIPLTWLAVAGTELRPSLLGAAGVDLRFFDVVVLGAVLGALRELPLGRPALPAGLACGAILVALVRAPEGEWEVVVETGHQVGIAVAAYLLTARLLRTPVGLAQLRVVLIAAGSLAAAKAVLLWGSGVDVLGGPDSVLQALSRAEPLVFSRRTILVGGTALCVLAPALVLGRLARRETRPLQAAALLVLPLLAIVASQTRAQVVGAATGIAAALALGRHGLDAAARRNLLTAAAVVWILAVVVTWQTQSTPWGAAFGRFQSEQARAISIGFRASEARAVVASLDGVDWVAGRGLGGTFELRAPGTDPEGNSYAHAWPLWVLLKSGLLGLALFGAAVAIALWRLRAWPGAGRGDLAAGLLGLLVAWMAVNALPLAEGEVLIGALLATAAAHPPTAER